MRRTLSSTLLACSLALVACGNKPDAKSKAQEFTGPIQPRKSTSKERESVSITIYNQDFGVVREVRTLDLPTGRVSLEYADVASHIQPETVHIRSLVPDGLTVFEQNYRYDLLTPSKLLEKYVGKMVKVYRFNQALGHDEVFDAEVISVEEGATFKINGEITYGWPGRISFPGVPDNLIAKPSLVWLLGTAVGKQKVEVMYVTHSLNWNADYVLSIDESDKVGDLVGWVTLNNRSGASYENATLKLVAGDVQKIKTPDEYAPDDADGAEDLAYAQKEAAPSFKEEGFFEYHLYTLSQPTSVMQNEQKQVTLLQAHGIGLDKKLIFSGANYYYRSSYGQVVSNQKVGVFLDIENRAKNKLGMPLPKGIVRVMKADKSGAKQFIGEDRIDHTPRDEKLRIKMGDAFDVVGDRKQMSWKPFGSCTSESEWEISLRNHKDVAETVEVVEPIGGDWEVLSSTHPHAKQDANTFTFSPQVPAKGEVKVKYRVRVRWC